MDASVFQSHVESSPTRPNKLRSRTVRMAEQLASQETSKPLPLPPLPRPPRLFFQPPPSPPTTPRTPPPPYTEAAQSHIMQVLSHPRLPLLLLLPLALLLAYTLHTAVQGTLHARHLQLERPLASIARIVEARAREAQWNSVAAVARIFAPPEQQPTGLFAIIGRWLRLI
ncbi:hypothetical protein EXIGLDRAFT_766719 [Exidia glandulosa HHB12029]|uniref:Uncharacterized protein n=1 Tax=Exidia glandulosa HHB12029 TaxID=1314781 RepID=A0A165JH80_EXIGL|nr:hypothetical protein EXIGLDRAFT_766719 [Exidia glandulosa HHB12029]